MYLHLPVLMVILLFGVSFVVSLLGKKRRNLAFQLTLLVLGIVFIISIYLLQHVGKEGPFSYHVGGWPPPWGVELYVDYLSAYVLMVLTSISFVVLIYGVEDLRHELKSDVLHWYCSLYLLLLGAMCGIALTNDLFNLYVFIEISTIAACGIISIKDDRKCIEASLKYLILSVMGSGCFLLAVAMLYMITGNLNFTYVAQELPHVLPLYPYNIVIALSLIIVSLGVKSALFPLHVWLPDAHSSAPSPSSAVLSGLVIKIYAVALVKLLFQVFPPQIFEVIPVLDIVLFLSVLAILAGSIIAMVQDDIKKMLAYSSIAQIGFVFMGIGLFEGRALAGGLLHIFNHAMMKAMLFLAAGLIIYASGIRKIRDLKGIGMRMPLTMLAFTVGAFSMVGIPGTNGFISKWHLALGALDLERPFFVAVILLSSLLNGIYYFPIVIDAFFGTQIMPQSEHKDVPALMLVPVMVLAVGIIFFGFYPAPVLSFIERAIGL